MVFGRVQFSLIRSDSISSFDRISTLRPRTSVRGLL